MEDQGRARRMVGDVLDRVQLEEDEQVVAGLDLAVDRAVELRQPLVEGDRTVLSDAVGEVVEALLDRAGQLPADHVVVVGEHGDAEVAGAAQVRPGLRRHREVDRDQRRVEAHRGERARGEADQPPVDLGRDGDHPGREDAEGLAQLGGVEVLVGGERWVECSHAARPFR